MEIQNSNIIPLTNKLKDIFFRMYLLDMDNNTAHLTRQGNELVFQTDTYSLTREQCATLCDAFPDTNPKHEPNALQAYTFFFTPNGVQIKFNIEAMTNQ